MNVTERLLIRVWMNTGIHYSKAHSSKCNSSRNHQLWSALHHLQDQSKWRLSSPVLWFLLWRDKTSQMDLVCGVIVKNFLRHVSFVCVLNFQGWLFQFRRKCYTIDSWGARPCKNIAHSPLKIFRYFSPRILGCLAVTYLVLSAYFCSSFLPWGSRKVLSEI